MPQVYDSEFRDQAAASKYPLDPTATQDTFENNLFLDLSLYVPSTLEPPFYISEVHGGSGDTVIVTITDASRNLVGTAVCDITKSSATIRDPFGRSLGVIVYDTEYLEAFRGDLGTNSITFIEPETRLASETCRFYTPKGMLNAVHDKYSLQTTLSLAFAGGLTIDGSGQVNLYGEHESLQVPLRSINGLPAKQVFLLSHVYDNYEDESAIRLQTQGTSVKIGKSRDF